MFLIDDSAFLNSSRPPPTSNFTFLGIRHARQTWTRYYCNACGRKYGGKSSCFTGIKSSPDEDRLLKHLFDPIYQTHNLKTTPIANVNERINVTVSIEIRKLIHLVCLMTAFHQTRKTVLDRGSRSDRPRYRVTTPTRAGLRRCRWPRPRHAARLAALARSWCQSQGDSITGRNIAGPPWSVSRPTRVFEKTYVTYF